ncbi:related to FMN1-Riboflavin kinase [Ramularia collo-cygni]|uniref:Riboflavin kinase n=1 Tax=Ramularia collo-cygni TaxID=112498 RepID=A0A2D3UMT1_9PEZI|nr:related to FMN1-Riboflavin kinase [Ramularia collo-cygni]CZT15681.1 related to FMN1-Riboflavin kinase [Ramularia collo-cygni]
MRPDGPRDTVAGPESGPAPPFPLRLNGKVIKGFGRGSSELGIPTANIPLSGLSVGGQEDIESGVYYGWAGLSPSDAVRQHPPGTSGVSKYKLMAEDVQTTLNGVLSQGKEKNGHADIETKGAVYPMVMSIGWNPFYKNTVRSVEVHIMHDFSIDFYGSHMNLLIAGFIRPELDYVSKESLIDDIKTDINVAGRSLSRTAYVKLMGDPYLLDFEGRDEIAS